MGSESYEPYFEWDAQKAAENRRKHRVTLEEAATVFADPHAGIKPDPDHSDAEERELRLLVVSFVQRGSAIRIISSRPATRKERHAYEES